MDKYNPLIWKVLQMKPKWPANRGVHPLKMGVTFPKNHAKS